MKKMGLQLIAILLPFYLWAQPTKPMKSGTHIIDSIAVDIWFPTQGTLSAGTLLVLPGWNFPKDDWCKKSSLCTKALALGYTLIMPEMGKSTYQAHNYPETRKDWLSYPTRTWMKERFFPTLEAWGVLTTQTPNYIIGLSTGARGVSLLCHDMPKLFKAAAALSGDYEQTKIPQDRVMIGYYGSFEQFPDRWKQEDNLVLSMKEFSTPIYLGHGKMDAVIPFQQTELFYAAIKKINPSLPVILHIDATSGHHYSYWNQELEAIFHFFQSL